MISRNISHYTILDKINGWGMGVVYETHDDRSVTPVRVNVDMRLDTLRSDPQFLRVARRMGVDK
jgi:hypothetical protein